MRSNEASSDAECFNNVRLILSVKNQPLTFLFHHLLSSLRSESCKHAQASSSNVASFTMEWNAGMGGDMATCADDVRDCPDDETKEDPRPIMIYAKGVKGTFDLRIKSIAAYGCGPEAASSQESSEIVVEDFSRPGR